MCLASICLSLSRVYVIFVAGEHLYVSCEHVCDLWQVSTCLVCTCVRSVYLASVCMVCTRTCGICVAGEALCLRVVMRPQPPV